MSFKDSILLRLRITILIQLKCNVSSTVLSIGHFIKRLSLYVFDSLLRITRVHLELVACIRNRSRVTRLVRANSKYKYVICRSKGACVTEHLPRTRGPPFVPQRAPTEEEGSLRQRKSMTYRQLPRVVT